MERSEKTYLGFWPNLEGLLGHYRWVPKKILSPLGGRGGELGVPKWHLLWKKTHFFVFFSQLKWREIHETALKRCNLSFCIFLDHCHPSQIKTQTATRGSKSCGLWYFIKNEGLWSGEGVLKNGPIKKLIADSSSVG